MSAAQNLAYSIVQVAHNFGAVAVVGGSLGGVVLRNAGMQRDLAWVALGGWATQALSGVAFGTVSYYFYQRFPDISGIAVFALMVKMACVATGFMLLAGYLAWGAHWSDKNRNSAWFASAALAVTALSAAAFLRWFS